MFGVLEEEEGRKADEIFRVIISVLSGYSWSSKQENSFGPALPSEIFTSENFIEKLPIILYRDIPDIMSSMSYRDLTFACLLPGCFIVIKRALT